MQTGLFTFFGKVLISKNNNNIYVSRLYEKLISIEADPDQRWLKVCFARPDEDSGRCFLLYARGETNGKFISCIFLKTETNYGLGINFSDGNLNIFCQDKQSLETLKARAEEFLGAPRQAALKKKAAVKQDALKKAVVKQDDLEKKAVVKLKKTRVFLRRVIKKA